MPHPVIVIHGIAMRKEEKVCGDVQRLNELIGEEVRLIPVYWGDLGASREHLPKLMGQYEARSENLWKMIGDSTAKPVASTLGRMLAWLTRRRGDEEMAAQIRAVANESTAAMDTRVRGYMNAKFQSVRLMLTQAVLPFVADVIVYQSPGYREKIHRRVREVIANELPDAGGPDRPVTVLAHSLGGIVAFDMAMAQDDPLHIDHLITLGSQPAFFHTLDPRPGGVPAYEGEPVTLKSTLRRWTNIWDEHDPLAFGVNEVFRLHDGSPPNERPIRCYTTAVRGAALFQGHLGYWYRKAAVAAIREALVAQEPAVESPRKSS